MRRGIDEIVRVAKLHPADQNRVLDLACYFLAQPCEIDISRYLHPVGLGADLPIKHRSRLESLLRDEEMITQHPVAAMLVSPGQAPAREAKALCPQGRYPLS
jgi:hypothetical protein